MILGRRGGVLLCLAGWLLQAAAAQSLRFGVIGDSGTGGSGQRAVARQMETRHQKIRWEFVLMLGDNIYDRGSPDDFDRKFKSVYRNLREAGVKFHATLGNHDMVDRRSRNGMAQVEDDDFGYVGRQDEYVLEAGPVVEGKRLARFICLNSSLWLWAMEKDRPQLEARLARLRGWLAESGKYHWNFVFQHHPLYSYTSSGGLALVALRRGHGPEDGLRTLLEPEMRGKIDVLLAGHEHFYQKIYPQQGIHHFISGAAAKIRRGGLARHPQVELTAEALHFLDMDLTAGALRYAAVSDTGQTLHSGEIRRRGGR